MHTFFNSDYIFHNNEIAFLCFFMIYSRYLPFVRPCHVSFDAALFDLQCQGRYVIDYRLRPMEMKMFPPWSYRYIQATSRGEILPYFTCLYVCLCLCVFICVCASVYSHLRVCYFYFSLPGFIFILLCTFLPYSVTQALSMYYVFWILSCTPFRIISSDFFSNNLFSLITSYIFFVSLFLPFFCKVTQPFTVLLIYIAIQKNS